MFQQVISNGQGCWPQDSSISPDMSAPLFASYLLLIVVFLLPQNPLLKVLTCHCPFQQSSESSSTYIPCCFVCCGGQTCNVWFKVVSPAALATIVTAATNVKPRQQKYPLHVTTPPP